jgi:predicted RNase H-like HicB family nuclease/predicted RNA binding protein YcfA (HicA-like mRNA interferase family)
VKVRGVIAELEADGWSLVRTKGSHRQFRHPVKSGTVTVAGKASVDVPIGTPASLEAGRAEEGLIRMEYVVIVEQGDSSYGAYVPDLPGCVAVGESRDEAMELIREAIELHIESLRENGEPVPEPHSFVEKVAV